ncbi:MULTISPECIES: hypothetical protein [unclassified Lactobacillus]|uniref:hypothetical protein n=1 Tax=unclassified Lactobacillus TaxID=2620435 RepID=UPI00226A1217|nr:MULTISPECIES: hypothetical protein [unclassified Lactobacillus]MCX8721311.1 hypothetical protein [Lactobacillus sp. B4010]MCX8732955.1 hypothetical protein [Lactobacillus sp. B4015]MCX8735608.1 hypothetical protein [Lactobacillus sp. B4012]
MESKTESTPTKGFVQVYKSTDSVPCEPWFAPADAEVAYPFTTDEPEVSLKAPKYDWANRRWFETDSATTGQALASINQTVQDLAKKVENGQVSQEAINQQIGSLTSLLSATAVAQNADSDKSEKAEEGDNK